MKRLGLALAIVVALPAAALSAPKQAAPPAEAKHDPDNVTAISQWMEAVAQGVEKYKAKDYPAAIDLFKKANQMSPKNALPLYLLGEAQLAANNLTEAEAAFKAARENTDAKNPLLRAHVLFAVADCLEREKKWEDAKTAWQEYAGHAAKMGPDAGAYPGTSTSRVDAIQKTLEREKAYVAVRERIAAEKSDGGPSATPPKK